MATDLITRPCFDAQVNFIKNLLARVERCDPEQGISFRDMFNEEWRANGRLSMDRASKVIGHLLDLVKALEGKSPQPVSAASSEIPSGRYAVNTDTGHLAFYRVWVGDRATLVFLIVSDSEQRLARHTAKAVLAKIADAGVFEASKSYGREIGCCGVCGRTLTNELSRSEGIGPICAGRFQD